VGNMAVREKSGIDSDDNNDDGDDDETEYEKN
jgi:hypothetical protein